MAIPDREPQARRAWLQRSREAHQRACDDFTRNPRATRISTMSNEAERLADREAFDEELAYLDGAIEEAEIDGDKDVSKYLASVKARVQSQEQDNSPSY